jgi:hypothetical protein
MKMMRCVLVSCLLLFISPLFARADIYWSFDAPGTGPEGRPADWTGWGVYWNNGSLTNYTQDISPYIVDWESPVFQVPSSGLAASHAAAESGAGAGGDIRVQIDDYSCQEVGADVCSVDLVRHDRPSEFPLGGDHTGRFDKSISTMVESGGFYSVRFTLYDFEDIQTCWSISDFRVTNVAVATPLFADFNDDGVVDAADYTLWRNNLYNEGAAYITGDANGDGIVNAIDYQRWKSEFGKKSFAGSGAQAAFTSIASATNVPEPTSAILLACCGTALVLRRFRNAASQQKREYRPCA